MKTCNRKDSREPVNERSLGHDTSNNIFVCCETRYQREIYVHDGTRTSNDSQYFMHRIKYTAAVVRLGVMEKWCRGERTIELRPNDESVLRG